MLQHSSSSSAGHYIYHTLYIYIYIYNYIYIRSICLKASSTAVSVGVCRAAISGTLLSLALGPIKAVPGELCASNMASSLFCSQSSGGRHGDIGIYVDLIFT